ncbi:MAG: peptide chain release factor 3 [Chitinophagales bacterium]|nr:peptide chain release factor 3 [Chitinophagales bacterium]MDW8272889.1 peptide chain release factor 3 [Chitinophagales bacterium]
MEILQEINRRKTFGIISHPDAGKTTLTEKLLLFGGAIQTAGAVKSNKIKKAATSDFMEIEKQRGISVATSVMTFEYRNYLINILDTPGHKDFAEDTYRTLTAVDSVIMVVDSVKGVEEQTRKLMEVCAMRKTPVIVFINKLDREGKDPFDLLEEIEKELKIKVQPLSWPINRGTLFKGVYNLHKKNLNLFRPSTTRIADDIIQISSLFDQTLEQLIGKTDAQQLREDVELIEGVYDPFDKEQYLQGNLAPVFFGSAVNNFGVQELLDTFLEIAPPPRGRAADKRFVSPEESAMTGFIFKIHANLDPKHRDRIAFMRIVSGVFERNKYYTHVRLGKELRFNTPVTFLGQDKNIVDKAYPGDVVGLYDTGNFKIGDTLTEGENIRFRGIPSFSPEIFKELINTDPMKSKQLEKGITQLTDEGVAQLFTQQPGNRKFIGTVGELQFEVIQYRLLHEYGASCKFQPINMTRACWITSHDKKKLEDFIRFKSNNIVYDKDGNLVYLAPSEWFLKMEQDNNPDISFHLNSEFKTSDAVKM